jgi:hypothetical protein
MNGVIRRAKHAAPGQYLGFALQPVRLCYHLLTCPEGARVSLELADDVAVHGADGSTVLEQAKSALSQNPVSDWADDLWKCLANWLDGVAAGFIDLEETHFRLYVTPVREGSRVQALSDATLPDEIEEITSTLRASLKKRKSTPSCAPFLQRFLDATVAVRVTMISRFKLISTDSDPVRPLRELLVPTVQPQLIDFLCQFAIGRAKETADHLIRSHRHAILDGDEFKAEFRSFVQKNNLPGLLTSLAPPPPTGAVVSLLAKSPTFIRQLDLVHVSEDERVRAVSDFLRSSADKSSWAEAGLIFEEGLREWDAELVRRQKLVCGEVSDVHSNKEPHIRGRIVYRQCAQMQPPLDGRVVPGHFVHGCLNSLADVKQIGWHPDYERLLGADRA